MYFEKLENRFLLSAFNVMDYNTPIILDSSQPFVINFEPRFYKNHLAADVIMQISDDSFSIGDHQWSSFLPKNSNQNNNSSLMLGSIYVEIVLFESNGTIDHDKANWTESQVINVKNETIEGFKWIYDTYKQNFPNSKIPLNFTVNFKYLKDPISTNYEMADNKPVLLYQTEFLNRISYNKSMYQYLLEKRETHKYDYAFAVFVANDQGEGLKQSGKAILGGPFAVLSYGNAGYGISRFSVVLAHEAFHVFNALDEYPGSFSYNMTSGYYGTQNTNAFDDNPNTSFRQTSLMSDFVSLNKAYSMNTSSIESFAMIGWKDSDGDGIFDAYDSNVGISASLLSSNITVQYSVVGIPSKLRHGQNLDITKMTADVVQINDGSGWVDFASLVNEYGGQVNLGSFQPGIYKIRIKNLEYSVYSNEEIIFVS